MEKYASIKFANKNQTVVVCAATENKNWKWLTDRVTSKINWKFVYYCPTVLDNITRKPDFRKILAAWRTVQIARKSTAEIIFSHEAETTFWVGLFCKVLNHDVKHIAVSFNYPNRPKFVRRWLMRKALRHVASFDVSSNMERNLYAEYFSVSKEKIHFQHWKVGRPPIPHEDAIVTGEYVCAIGEFGRDYETMLLAASNLPNIQFVLVVRPKRLLGLHIPANVRVLTDIPYAQAMNVLYHSQFLVLPLNSSTMPTGHITAVSAMHLGKAMIATDSSGIKDYAMDNVNALTYTAGDAANLSEQIELLYKDKNLCKQLGHNGFQFARDYCTEEGAVKRMVSLLGNHGVTAVM